MENLPRKFKKYLSESHEMFLEIGFSLDQIILDCLLKTYDSIEKSFLKIARKAKSMGSLKTGTVGACVLSVFVHDNKLYVANSGDCKGFICSSTEKNMIKCRKINKKLNTSSLSERNRLKLAFPLDSDICKQKNSQNKSFYLKNILQPTRAFGDYCLKYTEFNEEKSGKFHGPYLSHQPDVQIIEINEMDKFLILGSDGVWDMVKRKVLEHILEKNSRNIYSISENIFNFVTEQICILKGIALHYKIENLFYSILGVDKEELMGMPLGSERRKYHDDISLMVVDLKNQFKQT